MNPRTDQILTINWDIDNKELISLRKTFLPKVEISFNRDFAYPDLWIYESEEHNFSDLKRLIGRTKYFTVYFARNNLHEVDDFSFFAIQLAQQKVVVFNLYDDVLFFIRKMVTLKNAAGLITTTNAIFDNLETEKEKILIKKHSIEVGELCYRIAAALNEEDKNFKIAGYIHDIGKLCLPASLLLSNKIFDDNRIKIFQLHTLWGEELIKLLLKSGETKFFNESAGFHHERLNGCGYLRGTRNIPQIAKIIAVSDVYTTLTSDRPYRFSFDKDVAMTYIKAKAGELFDSHVVEALMKVA